MSAPKAEPCDESELRRRTAFAAASALTGISDYFDETARNTETV